MLKYIRVYVNICMENAKNKKQIEIILNFILNLLSTTKYT